MAIDRVENNLSTFPINPEIDVYVIDVMIKINLDKSCTMTLANYHWAVT